MAVQMGVWEGRLRMREIEMVVLAFVELPNLVSLGLRIQETGMVALDFVKLSDLVSLDEV